MGRNLRRLAGHIHKDETIGVAIHLVSRIGRSLVRPNDVGHSPVNRSLLLEGLRLIAEGLKLDRYECN